LCHLSYRIINHTPIDQAVSTHITTVCREYSLIYHVYKQAKPIGNWLHHIHLKTLRFTPPSGDGINKVSLVLLHGINTNAYLTPRVDWFVLTWCSRLQSQTSTMPVNTMDVKCASSRSLYPPSHSVSSSKNSIQIHVNTHVLKMQK
jgi:hypothetical protein